MPVQSKRNGLNTQSLPTLCPAGDCKNAGKQPVLYFL